MTVTVYSAPACMACKLTKRHLDKLGLPYHEAHVDDVRHIAADKGIQSAPVVVVNHGEQMWGGYRPDKIDALVRPTARA